MLEKPIIVPEQWITVGMQKAVVRAVHDGTQADCTVFYLDERNRPMQAEVRWTERGWECIHSTGLSDSARTDAEGRRFLTILRTGIRAAPAPTRRPRVAARGSALKPSSRR